MAQQAELHGEAKAVHAAALGPHQQDVVGAEHVVPGVSADSVGTANRRARCSADSRVRRDMGPREGGSLMHNLLAFRCHSATEY